MGHSDIDENNIRGSIVIGGVVGFKVSKIKTKSEKLPVKLGVLALNCITIPCGILLGVAGGFIFGVAKKIYDIYTWLANV
ncbi:hypothetical protein OAG24_00685 [bacterium]|nr:hypothetical protein [bacterium]